MFSVSISTMAESKGFKHDYSEIYQLNKAGEFLASKELLNKILRKDNKLSTEELLEALRLRGSVHLRLGEYEKAVSDFSSLLRINRNNVWALTQRCHAMTQLRRITAAKGDCSRASRLLQRVPELDQTGAIYRTLVQAQADLLVVDARQVDALKIILTALNSERIDQRWELEWRAAELEANIDEFQKSIDRYKGVLKIVPKSLQGHVYSERGDVYFRMSQYENAISDYQKALESNHRAPRNRYNICASYLRLKKTSAALEFCSECTDATDPLPIDGYGIALLSAAKDSEAVDLYESYYKNDSENNFINAHYFLALKRSGLRPDRLDELDQKLKPVFKQVYLPQLEELLVVKK